MTWQLPDTYHQAGHGLGTATLKFYEGRDILSMSPERAVELIQMQNEIFAQVPIPDGAQTVGAGVIGGPGG